LRVASLKPPLPFQGEGENKPSSPNPFSRLMQEKGNLLLSCPMNRRERGQKRMNAALARVRYCSLRLNFAETRVRAYQARVLLLKRNVHQINQIPQILSVILSRTMIDMIE